METFNIESVELQKIVITLTLSDREGTPADLDAYDVYAASAGIVNPYSLQPRRDAWAVEKNAEGTAYVLTSPGHDIPHGPWKYCIYIKQLSTGLEWPAVFGKITLIPRTTEEPGGISPAPYAVQAETAVTGLVHCVLDAALSAETVNNQMAALRAEAEKAAASAAEAAESLRLVTETLAINENDDYLIFNKGLTQFSYRLQYAEDCKYLMAGKLIKDCTMSLPSATNCSNMFLSCGSLQTVNLEIPSATNCSNMFLSCGALQSANLNLPSATNCSNMFQSCTSLKTVNLEIPSATNCSNMFQSCGALQTVNLELPSATNCSRMFQSCVALQTVNLVLPSATNCSEMFLSCGSLQTVNLELPSATDCSRMFQSCVALQTVNLEIPSATNCDWIFVDSNNIVSSVLNAPLSTRFHEAYNRCPSLMEWDGDLSSALVCTHMFSGCRLNLRSVRNIARTIRDLAAKNNTGSITIGITKNIKGTEELATALAAIRAKGWTVTEQYV